jgi:hypothetical protein
MKMTFNDKGTFMNIKRILLISGLCAMSVGLSLEALAMNKNTKSNLQTQQSQKSLWTGIKNWNSEPSNSKAIAKMTLGAMAGIGGGTGVLGSFMMGGIAKAKGDHFPSIQFGIVFALIGYKGVKHVFEGIDMYDGPCPDLSVDSLCALPWNSLKGAIHGVSSVIEYKSKTQWNTHYGTHPDAI